jgi:hypothetical protein
MFILFILLLAGVSYGQEQQEEESISSMAGLNVEVSATSNRDIVNVGLWLAEPGRLMHVGLYGIKPKNGGDTYGIDIGMGYCATGFFLWPSAEIGVKLGAGAGLTSFSAELYPKIGLNIPITDQLLIYVAFLYSFSSQGRQSDYSAASVGFVWAIL